jgi:hypothetical protein
MQRSSDNLRSARDLGRHRRGCGEVRGATDRSPLPQTSAAIVGTQTPRGPFRVELKGAGPPLDAPAAQPRPAQLCNSRAFVSPTRLAYIRPSCVEPYLPAIGEKRAGNLDCQIFPSSDGCVVASICFGPRRLVQTAFASAAIVRFGFPFRRLAWIDRTYRAVSIHPALAATRCRKSIIKV